MKFFFDTEFIEDGKTIDLVSIGIVCDDGGRFYAESSEFDASKASPWVVENVLKHLEDPEHRMTRADLKEEVLTFVHAFSRGQKPEFWSYYADYDWVVLCQLFGTMMDLPKGWPMYCRDLKQWCDQLGNPPLPKNDAHHALTDALWIRDQWHFLTGFEEALRLGGLT